MSATAVKRQKSTKQKSVARISLQQDPDFTVDHGSLLQMSKYHDLTFIFDDKNQVPAHKFVVEQRCKKMLEEAAKPSKKNKKGYEVDPEKVRVEELRRCLHFLYADAVDFATLQLNDCIRLIKTAHMYGLKRLAQMCENFLQSSINMQNIFDLIRFADVEKVATAKKICLEFAIANNKEFIIDSRVESLAIGLFQEIIISKERAFATENWAPEKFTVTEESTLRKDFKKIYDEMPGADSTFEIEGQKIKCHRAILAHFSSKLENVMETAKKEPFKLPEKEWKNFTAEAFASLLKFIYYYDMDIKPLPATQLINFAKDFGVAHLADVCENKIRSGIAKNTVLSIMEVAYHPLMEDKPELQKELRINCSRFFVEHIKDIDLEPLKDMKAEVGTDLLLAMQKEIGKTWMMLDVSKAGPAQGPASPTTERSAEEDAGAKSARKHKRDSSDISIPKGKKAEVLEVGPVGSTNLEIVHEGDAPAAAPAEAKKEEAAAPAEEAKKDEAAPAAAEEKPAADEAKKDEAAPAGDAAAETVDDIAANKRESKREKKDKKKDKKSSEDEAAAEEPAAVAAEPEDGGKDKKKDKKDKKKDKN